MPTVRPLALMTAVALTVTACASADPEAPSSALAAGVSPSPSSVIETEAGYPSSVPNCGTDVATGDAPDRILAIKSSAAELLLALGLEDKMIGAAYLDGPLDPGYGDDGDSVEVVSDAVPGQEAVLALDPDAIFAGWESNFSADGAGERSDLAQLGITTYVAPSACKGDAMPSPMTFSLLFDQVREAGAVFGATEEAEALAATLEEELDEIEPDGRGLTALWYSSGSDTPYVGAGQGAPQMVMKAAGLANIAADVDDTWTSLTWEAVAERNPEVLILVDAAWNTAENKIEVLEANPATAALRAVQTGSYVIVPFPASEAGVRSVAAVESITRQLADLGLES